MPDLSLVEHRELTAVTTDSLTLLSLDAAWTAACTPADAGSGGAAPAVAEGVGDVVTDMTALLGRMPQHAETIARIAQAHAGAAQEALAVLMRSDALGPAERSELRSYLLRHGDLAGMTRAATATLSTAKAETSALHEQAERMTSGGGASGDLSKGFRCGLIQNLIIGGALSIPSGVVAALAASAAAAGILATTGVAGIGLILVGLWWARHTHC